MPSRFRFAAVLLVATLMVVVGCSMSTPMASGNGVEALHLTFNSIQTNGATANLGIIKVDVMTADPLPGTGTVTPPFPKGPYALVYIPAPGYYFVKWEKVGPITIGNPNAQSTTVTFLSASEGTVTAFYQKMGLSVGGVVIPTNTYLALASYLVTIGLVATAAVAVKKRRN